MRFKVGFNFTRILRRFNQRLGVIRVAVDSVMRPYTSLHLRRPSAELSFTFILMTYLSNYDDLYSLTSRSTAS